MNEITALCALCVIYFGVSTAVWEFHRRHILAGISFCAYLASLAVGSLFFVSAP